MFVLGLSRRHLHQLWLQGVNSAQKPLDTLDLAGTPVRRFHRTVPEVLLNAEQVDPALGYWNAHHHVLAGHAAELARREAWYQDVCSYLDLEFSEIRDMFYEPALANGVLSFMRIMVPMMKYLMYYTNIEKLFEYISKDDFVWYFINLFLLSQMYRNVFNLMKKDVCTC